MLERVPLFLCHKKTCATEEVAESKSRKNNFEDRMCFTPWQESVAAVRGHTIRLLVDRAVAVERAIAAWQTRAGVGAVASTERWIHVWEGIDSRQ